MEPRGGSVKCLLADITTEYVYGAAVISNIGSLKKKKSVLHRQGCIVFLYGTLLFSLGLLKGWKPLEFHGIAHINALMHALHRLFSLVFWGH